MRDRENMLKRRLIFLCAMAVFALSLALVSCKKDSKAASDDEGASPVSLTEQRRRLWHDSAFWNEKEALIQPKLNDPSDPPLALFEWNCGFANNPEADYKCFILTSRKLIRLRHIVEDRRWGMKLKWLVDVKPAPEGFSEAFRKLQDKLMNYNGHDSERDVLTIDAPGLRVALLHGSGQVTCFKKSINDSLIVPFDVMKSSLPGKCKESVLAFSLYYSLEDCFDRNGDRRHMRWRPGPTRGPR